MCHVRSRPEHAVAHSSIAVWGFEGGLFFFLNRILCGWIYTERWGIPSLILQLNYWDFTPLNKVIILQIRSSFPAGTQLFSILFFPLVVEIFPPSSRYSPLLLRAWKLISSTSCCSHLTESYPFSLKHIIFLLYTLANKILLQSHLVLFLFQLSLLLCKKKKKKEEEPWEKSTLTQKFLVDGRCMNMLLIILMYPSKSFSVIFYNMKYKKDIIAMLKKERYNGRCKSPILWSDL